MTYDSNNWNKRGDEPFLLGTSFNASVVNRCTLREERSDLDISGLKKRLVREREISRAIGRESDRGIRERYGEGVERREGKEREREAEMPRAGKRKLARVRKGDTASRINSDHAPLENFRTGRPKDSFGKHLYSMFQGISKINLILLKIAFKPINFTILL